MTSNPQVNAISESSSLSDFPDRVVGTEGVFPRRETHLSKVEREEDPLAGDRLPRFKHLGFEHSRHGTPTDWTAVGNVSRSVLDR